MNEITSREPPPLPGLPVRFAGALLVVLVVLIALARLSPPPPLSRDAAQGDFSAERALDHVRALASGPRPPDSLAHDKARDYVVDELKRLGLAPVIREAESTVHVAGKYLGGHVENILVRIPGNDTAANTAGGRGILLASHYDSVPNSPGAADDAAAVATLLETARALRASRTPLKNDVWMLFTDGEELGLLGAYAFVRDEPPRQRFAAILNFEARGNQGPVAMFDTGPNHGVMIDALASAPDPVAASWWVALAKYLPNDTDLTAFSRAGVPGMAFACADGFEHYHHYSDTADALDPGTLQHFGSYALSLARELGRRDLEHVEAPNLVFFDVLGLALVRYSDLVARLLALATLGGCAWLIQRTQRLGRAKLRDVVRRALFLPVLVLLAVGLPTLIVLASLQTTEFLGLLAQSKVLAWTGILWAACVAVFASGRASERLGEEAVFLGYALGSSAVLGIVAWWCPSLTPPVQWPLLCSTAGSIPWLIGGRPRPVYALVARAAGVAAAAVVAVPVLYSAILALGQFSMVVAACIALPYCALALPPIDRWATKTRQRTAHALFAGAAACLVLGLVLARESGHQLKTSSLLYGLDQDVPQAHFLTFDAAPDPWVTQFVSPARLEPLTKLLLTDDPILHGPAVAIQPPRSDIVVTEDRPHGSGRDLALLVRSEAECFQLWQDEGPGVTLREVSHIPVSELTRFSPELDATLLRLVSGDHSRQVFQFYHCGFARDGVALHVTTEAPGTIDLRLVEELPGLPAVAGIARAPRPVHLRPAQKSDVMLLSRGFRM